MQLNHYHQTHPRLRGVRAKDTSGFPEGTLTPAQVLIAYGFFLKQYATALANAGPVKIGIGSVGGGVVQADIDNFTQAWGIPAPNLEIRTVGGARNDPSDQSSSVEVSLDITIAAAVWALLTGKPADIVICFGPNQGNGLALVTADLAAAGCQVISWSWGSAASQWAAPDRTALSSTISTVVQNGVTITAASGDNSLDDGTDGQTADYPSSDPNVWGVGGTKLAINSNGSRASEIAWGDGNPGDEGGGGGFDPVVTIPSFQSGVIPVKAPGRGVPDTSANADPQSGWQISANGSWTVVGGTSAASPFTATLIAVAKALASVNPKGMVGVLDQGLLTPAIYAARVNAINDITKGSDGSDAGAGWDEATGLGSPNGPAFVNALVTALSC